MTPEPAEKPPIPRPVWFLGWTSLFTDAATEMIYPLLPVYLSRVLGATAVSLGIIEGVAEGVNSLLKVFSGYWSDRVRRRRPIVIGGYALSSIARPFIAVTTTWPQVLVVRALDRVGKGIRGAPRDVLLARFATPSTRGRIYGFHRAMDHTGAIVGPLVATVILFFAPEQYRLLFALTIIPGAIAVALLFLVDEDPATGEPANPRTTEPPNLRTAREAPLPGRVIALLGVLLVFGLGNSADAFLLLRLADALGGATYVPLLWAGIHVVKASLSTWGGGLSDTFGRKRMIVAGWIVYALVYFGFAMSTSAPVFIAWFLFYGVYFALAEGAEKALVADLTPAERRGAAFGWYNATTGVGALIASILFGYLYDRFGAPVAFVTGAALAGVAAVLLLLIPTDTIKDSDVRHPGHQ
ncbi:MAG TPA: MFS transporter [Vicinamibacterales bacterium]|nr:MFS transporter [Vicinamibacterales bacterium]